MRLLLFPTANLVLVRSLIFFSPTGANRRFEPCLKYKKCHCLWHFGAPSRVSAFRKIAPMGNFLASNGRHNHHSLYFTITLFSDDVSVRLRQERTVGSSPILNTKNATACGILAPRVGLEPTTYRLTAECSTIELSRHFDNIYYIIKYSCCQ